MDSKMKKTKVKTLKCAQNGKPDKLPMSISRDDLFQMLETSRTKLRVRLRSLSDLKLN